MCAVIKLVAAYSLPFRVIGKDGKLPWRYPEDLAKFRLEVAGCTLLGGAKTLKEVAFLKLPTIQIHRDTDWNALKELAKSKDLAIVGGEAVFKEGIKHADLLSLTEILKTYSGDKFFPEIPEYFEWIWAAQSAQAPDLVYKTWRRK